MTPSEAMTTVPGFLVLELETVKLADQTWYRLRGIDGQRLVRADARGQATALFPDEIIKARLNDLRPSNGQPTLVRLVAYDDMYYASSRADAIKKPLPVWRAQWADGVSLYADPASGRLIQRADGSNKWQRTLYNGLHSLDFSVLLERPWLRHTLVWTFSLLGIGLCVTSCVIALRALARKRQRPRLVGRGTPGSRIAIEQASA
jgi:hypothetical protein